MAGPPISLASAINRSSSKWASPCCANNRNENRHQNKNGNKRPLSGADDGG